MIIRNKKIKTFFIEAVFVASVLFFTFIYNSSYLEAIASFAVFFTFMELQVNRRTSEAQEVQEKPTVHCYRWSLGYFSIKEVLWITFFICSGAYSGIIGSALFMAYPIWRRFYLKQKDKAISQG